MRRVIAAHILPSSIERRRAKLLRHNALLYYLAFTFIILVGVKTVSVKMPGVLGYASNISTSDLLKYTNEERKLNGLGELTLNTSLSKGAEEKAADMFKNDYWAHVSPDGREPWYFFNKVGYDYSFAGENLAKNFNDSKGVVRAWMNSPSHRENLLNPNYNEIGFAVVNGELQGYKTTLVVQFFGVQRGVAVAQQPAVFEEKQASKVEGVSNKTPELNSIPVANPSLPTIDVYLFTKTLALVLGGFLILLFGVDFWYSSTKGVVKLNGHTLAHIFLLAMLIVSLGFAIVPGRVG